MEPVQVEDIPPTQPTPELREPPLVSRKEQQHASWDDEEDGHSWESETKKKPASARGRGGRGRGRGPMKRPASQSTSTRGRGRGGRGRQEPPAVVNLDQESEAEHAEKSISAVPSEAELGDEDVAEKAAPIMKRPAGRSNSKQPSTPVKSGKAAKHMESPKSAVKVAKISKQRACQNAKKMMPKKKASPKKITSPKDKASKKKRAGDGYVGPNKRTTFAGRRCPAGDAAKTRFLAVADAFHAYIAPHIPPRSVSSHEVALDGKCGTWGMEGILVGCL